MSYKSLINLTKRPLNDYAIFIVASVLSSCNGYYTDGFYNVSVTSFQKYKPRISLC